MKQSSPDHRQMSFMSAGLMDQLNPKHPLLCLARSIPWDFFESEFAPQYAAVGRPAKPIRLMVGLSILKHMENVSDELIVQHRVQNPYDQAFCGEVEFQWSFPCDPSDMLYFRKRIGAKGFEKILASSIILHGEKAIEEEVCIDTRVQEKNISFPTDAKLYRKMIVRCLKLARKKVSITTTRDSKIIVGAMAFDSNTFDGHTLPEVLQLKRLNALNPAVGLCDRGYKGKNKINDTRILRPGTTTRDTDSAYQALMRKRFRKRAGIEPVMGHLKSDHGLNKNDLKRFEGDPINVLMAAAAFNFRKWMRLFLLASKWANSWSRLTEFIIKLPHRGNAVLAY